MVEIRRAAEVFEAVGGVAIGEKDGAIVRQSEAIGEASLPEMAGGFVDGGRREVNGAACAPVAVVVEYDCALAVVAVRIGEDVFIDGAVIVPEIVEDKVGALGEESAVLE